MVVALRIPVLLDCLKPSSEPGSAPYKVAVRVGHAGSGSARVGLQVQLASLSGEHTSARVSLAALVEPGEQQRVARHLAQTVRGHHQLVCDGRVVHGVARSPHHP